MYLLPPSITELRTRLLRRAGDAPEEITRRLRQAGDEVRSYRRYDYIVRNENLKDAGKELEAIITAERIRTPRLNVSRIEDQVAKEFATGGDSVPGKARMFVAPSSNRPVDTPLLCEPKPSASINVKLVLLTTS